MTEELLRPTEVAAELGMAANTLRVYSARFAPLLAPPAARPGAGRGGRPGHRLYTPQDVAVLRRARDLVTQGLTYEQALAQLRHGLTAADRDAPAPEEGESSAHLASLQQAVEAWRALAEERAREVTALRAQVEALRADLTQERSRRMAAEELIRLATAAAPSAEAERQTPQGSWLARIFSGEPEGRAGRK